MNVIFARHGESTANIGLPSDNHATIALTERGHQQAQALSKSWTSPPTRIFVSPFLRTQLTAAPTLARFPGVPVEVLPMEEFTYLQPGKWVGSTPEDRKPSAEAYWSTKDPEFCDGPGAESFSRFLGRIRIVLDRLEMLEGNHLAFTHGKFMMGLRGVIRSPSATPKEMMDLLFGGQPFANTEQFEIELKGGIWKEVSAQPRILNWGPLFCDHANESPHRCPCTLDCYCKSYSCLNR